MNVTLTESGYTLDGKWRLVPGIFFLVLCGGSYVMTESREEAKIRLRGFVEEYVALCEKYKAEVLVNSYGVHCVETDAGLSFAFKSVYPEWDVDDEGEEEEES